MREKLVSSDLNVNNYKMSVNMIEKKTFDGVW